MNDLIAVSSAGVIQCMKIELIKSSSDVKRGIMVYKASKHFRVVRELLAEFHLREYLSSSP